MKKTFLFSILTVLILSISIMSDAQVAGGSIYLPGNWVECGIAANGSWGAGAAPAGYHPYTGWTNIASVYNWQHSATWTGGTPGPIFGDYTYPGTPFEGWSMQANGARSDAFYTTGGGVGTSFYNQTAAVSKLTGANTTYTNTGGTATAVWQGTTTGTSGGLAITQTTSLAANASWIVTTVQFTNTSAAAIAGVYYWRTFDPDNDETHSGNFATTNTIVYQNDVDHRVLVSAIGTVYSNAYIGLGTKDCRAKAMIYDDWAPYPAYGAGDALDKVYAGTATGLGATYYGLGNQTVAQDIAVGLVFDIGTIPAGGTAYISYASIYDGNLYPATSIDSAFPEPLLVVNGVSIPPAGPAPDSTVYTFNACAYPSLTTLPVNINNATTQVWTGSTWTWSPATGLSSTTGVTNNINLASLPATITYTITGTNAAFCGARKMYLTVLTCNGATVNSPCYGGSLDFNAPGDSIGATYSWYGPAPSTTVVSTSQSFTITPAVWADTGTYHVIKTVAGVSDTSLCVAIIYPTPVLTASSNSPLCAGSVDTLRLTVTSTVTPVTYSWTGPAGFTSTLQNPTIPGFTFADSGTYYVTATSANGCTGTTSTHVALLPPPGPPVITDPSPYCQNAAFVPFSITATGTVYWYPSAAGVGGTTTIPTVNTAVTGTYTFYYNQTVGNCISPIDSIKVIVNPVDPITGTTSLCERRATITLSDAITGGTWSSGNPTIATITPATGIVSGVTPGASPSVGVATISYTNPYGCISTIAVNVNPTPVQPAIVTDTACQFWTMGALTPVGPTYTWWGPGVTAGSHTSPIPQSDTAGIDSFYVTVTSSFGCESDSTLETAVIKPKPSRPLTTDTAYCQLQPNPAQLVTMVSGYTGTLDWYNSTPPVLLGSVDTPSTLNYTYPDSLRWWVAQTINGCEGDSAEVAVTIIPKPEFGIINQPWVCQLDSISLLYNSELSTSLVEGSYLWTLPAGATAVNGSSVTDSFIYVQFDSTGQNNYVYLTVGDLNGECSTTDTILMDVVELPTANAYSKADVCLSDTVTLALSSKSADATSFTWYIDNSTLFSSGAATIIAANSNSGGPYSIQWTDTGMHVIHVQAFAEHGCASLPSSDSVYVHGLPDATFRITTSTGTLCLEDSVLFSANDSSYQNNYSWAPVHFFGNNNIDKHEVWGKVEQTQSVVTLTITDPFGCVASGSRELDPSTCCNVEFPNAFSPNGDGRNDVFRPIPSTAYHIYHKFVIENRWGQVIFEAVNNTASWDGTFNGVPQDIGVYYYYLKYDCNGNTVEQKGDVTLVR